MKNLVSEFKDFIMQGNVVALAVAVVIGTAFKSLIDSFVADLITPLIAAFGGQPDFSQVKFTINGSQFMIGNFINTVIAFLIIAAVIFFFVVKPMNTFTARMKTEESDEPELTNCPYCFTQVSVEAIRCPSCTSELKGPSVV